MNVTHHCTDENKQISGMEITNQYFHWILRGGISVVIALGIVYLIMLNTLATQGFELEDLKAERLQMQKELELVDIQLAIPSSLYALQSSEQVQEMTDIKTKHYLYIKNGEVAYTKIEKDTGT